MELNWQDVDIDVVDTLGAQPSRQYPSLTIRDRTYFLTNFGVMEIEPGYVFYADGYSETGLPIQIVSDPQDPNDKAIVAPDFFEIFGIGDEGIDAIMDDFKERGAGQHNKLDKRSRVR